MTTQSKWTAWMLPFAELLGFYKPELIMPSAVPLHELKFIAKCDVYHQSRAVLLLKAEQRVGPKTLVSLERQGISVLDCCEIEDADGTRRPLDATILRELLDEFSSQSKIQRVDLDRVIALQASQDNQTVKSWQRHFKVMIVSQNKKHQDRLRRLLESEGVLAQHIHPIMQVSMFSFAYEKHKPTCLILDVPTMKSFAQQGISVLEFAQRFPYPCLENVVLLNDDEIPTQWISVLNELEKVSMIPYPLRKVDIDAVVSPILNSLKRLYFEMPQPTNELYQSTPLKSNN